MPTCKAGKIEATTTTSAEKACKTAIIGKGTTDVEVLFPESAPIQIKSKLIAFNGGISGGKTTLLIHAYLSNPIAAAIVTTVKVSRLINLRREHIALREGLYRPLAADGDLLLFFRELRDERLLIALNMGSQPISVALALSGSVLLSSFADRETETLENTIDLRGQ